MRAPPFLASMRAWIAAQRRPEDPVDVMPGPCHVVRLAPLLTPLDQRIRWDAAQVWCHRHVEHAAGHLWSRRIDRGPHHDQMVPVFSFSDAVTADRFRRRF